MSTIKNDFNKMLEIIANSLLKEIRINNNAETETVSNCTDELGLNSEESSFKEALGLNEVAEVFYGEAEEMVGTNKRQNFIMTGKELLDMKVVELPYLVKGLIPQTGVVALAGSSDTGKSSLLRQLATAIVNKDKEFLGFEITAEHNNAIYVSTEDDEPAMAYLLQKQNAGFEQSILLENLRFIFETEHLLKKLGVVLEKHPTDCVIIDTFSDLFGGDLNAANKVRHFLNDYYNLAKKHKCLIIFLHHTGKRTEHLPPSKDNLIGSQGFEGKMRLVLELRKDYTDPSLRHLCIVKGNYIPEASKGRSYVLKFHDNMVFSYENRMVPFSQLAKPDPRKKDNSEAILKAMEYYKQGLSIRQVKAQMDEDGFKSSKSTIAEWLKKCPDVHPPKREQDDGQENDEPDEHAEVVE